MKRLICTVLCILLAFAVVTPVGIADSGTEANEERRNNDCGMGCEVTEHVVPVTINKTENGVCYTSEERLNVDDGMEYEVTEHVVPVTINKTENGVCYTWWGEETEGIDMSKGVPERTKTKTFYHYFYSLDDQYLATITSVVSGVYSQADNYALITSITPSVSGPSAGAFSTSIAISGDTGYLDVYFLSIYYTTLTYCIYPNGTISVS